MKNIINRFKELTTFDKLRIITASILTIALMISLPAYAWFTIQRKAAEMYEVEAPSTLILSAAHREDSVNFEVKGIDADEILVDGNNNPIKDANEKEQKITYKDYVFCVTGDSIDKFTIQLAYTTNNPFTYEVYAAKELTKAELDSDLEREHVVVSGTEVDYVEYDVQNDPAEGVDAITLNDTASQKYHQNVSSGKLYYRIDKSVNEGNNNLANGIYTGTDIDKSTHLSKSYGGYSNIQEAAKPSYWQATNVSAIPGQTNSNKESFSRHFILRVKWTAGTLNNQSKETDIVYITVRANNT